MFTIEISDWITHFGINSSWCLTVMGIQKLLKTCDFELLKCLDIFDSSYPKIIMALFALNTENDLSELRKTIRIYIYFFLLICMYSG